MQEEHQVLALKVIGILIQMGEILRAVVFVIACRIVCALYEEMIYLRSVTKHSH